MKSTSNKRYEKGQGLVEYALILVLIAIVVIGTLSIFGTRIKNGYYGIAASLHTSAEDCVASNFTWQEGIGCVAVISVP